MKTCVIFAGTLRNFARDSFERDFLQDRDDVRAFASCNSRFLSAPSYVEQSIEMFSLPSSWKFVQKAHAWNGYNTASMYYHNQKAFELAMRRFPEAEVVVKYRSDVSSQERFPHPLEPLAENAVYLPNCNDYGGVNDQIAYGTPKSMEAYCSLYEKIQAYVESGVPYHPETLLAHHLRKVNVEIRRFNFKYGLDPSRHNTWN